MQSLSTFAAVIDGGNNDVVVSVVSMISALGVAYITSVLANRYKEKKAKAEPKDRVELLFERYDEALKQKDADNDELRGMLKEAEAKLHEANLKLNRSDRENGQLKDELENLKRKYRTAAKLDQQDRDNIQSGLNESNKRNKQ